MESLDYWRMCDDLSVIQSIILILGRDPKHLETLVESHTDRRPEGYEAVSAALKMAVLRGRLPANVCVDAWEHGWGQDVSEDAAFAEDQRGKRIIYQSDPNWHRTTISVDDLKTWLEARGVRPSFFFAPREDTPAYLNSSHKQYAGKLAAALEAWEAVTTDKALTKNRSVKSALTTWLNKNADRFGLTKEDGTPNKQAIEEAAKVANWDTKGGAPKTQSEPTPPFLSPMNIEHERDPTI